MDGSAIPQDEDTTFDMTLQMLNKLHHLRAFDAALVDLKVESSQGDAANDGKAFPVETLVQQRCLPLRCPSAHTCRLGAQPAFVDKDDGAALLPGVFFNLGQVLRFHVAMAFSSRSMARRSGL